jgi:hypothetical protein
MINWKRNFLGRRMSPGPTLHLRNRPVGTAETGWLGRVISVLSSRFYRLRRWHPLTLRRLEHYKHCSPMALTYLAVLRIGQPFRWGRMSS